MVIAQENDQYEYAIITREKDLVVEVVVDDDNTKGIVDVTMSRNYIN